MKIHCSEAAHDILSTGGRFTFVPRGEVEIKVSKTELRYGFHNVGKGYFKKNNELVFFSLLKFL